MNDFKMHRKCGACRAFKSGYFAKCDLGYDIKQINLNGVGVNAEPKEECPKPLKVWDYVDAVRHQNKTRYP